MSRSSACKASVPEFASESQQGVGTPEGPRLYTPPCNNSDAQLPSLRSMYHANTLHQTLFHRHPKNPILSAAEWPYPINTVFNAGATLLPDGTTLLLCRVEDRRGLSHFCAARSKSGIDGWEIDSQPTLMPDPEHYPEE